MCCKVQNLKVRSFLQKIKLLTKMYRHSNIDIMQREDKDAIERIGKSERPR